MSRITSRIDLSRKLGLNKSTVTSIVTELLDAGLVIEVAEGESSPQGGRRPVHLELNRQYGYVLGFELRPESYTVCAVDLVGDILFSRTVRMRFSSENFKSDLLIIIEEVKREVSWIGMPLLGIGIGVSGIVDSRGGIIMASIPLEFDEAYNFYQEISRESEVPVFVENDANSCAWGELAFHRSKHLKNFLFTLVEFRSERQVKDHERTAVGMGLIVDGKVHYGLNHSAGEFKSVFCRPGHLGQFVVSSENYFVDNDEALLREFVEELSKHIAFLVNTLNLSQVFLGGDIERYQNLVMPILIKAINDNWAYPNPVDCEIRFSSLGEKAVAYGSAGLVLERLFEGPEEFSDSPYLEGERTPLNWLLDAGAKVPV